MNMRHPLRKPLDSETIRAFALMEEASELRAKFSSDFNAVESVWVGDTLLQVTKRNSAHLISPFTLPVADYVYPKISKIIDDVTFHFLNYANSSFALREFLYKGYIDIPESLKLELHSMVTDWKQTPHQRIITAMRNRFHHGGKLIRGIRTHRQFDGHPCVPKWTVGVDLYEHARAETRKELSEHPKDIRELFDAVTKQTGSEFLGFDKFIGDAQHNTEMMYEETNKLIKALFAEAVVQYEAVLNRLQIIEVELRAMGLTRLPP